MAADTSTPPPSVVRRALLRTFGPPAIDPSNAPGDPGLTGPGSASWRVIGEPAAIAGGVRGLLVQLAHPLAMAGVHDHSAFRTDPLGRLQRTSAYVTTTTFGSTDEALAVTRRVRAVHRRVHGVAPDGRSYTADEPRLLTWVSVALTSSFLAAYRLWAPDTLTPRDADRFVAEQSRIAALLDPRLDLRDVTADARAREELREARATLPMLEEGSLPTTVAALDDVIASFRHELGINRQAREALGFLRHPPLGRGATAGYRLLLLGVLASLDPDVTAALELRWAPGTRRPALGLAGAAVAALRRGAGPSPTLTAATTRITAVE
jgi:uncharacterized protein (DUF2236 family)